MCVPPEVCHYNKSQLWTTTLAGISDMIPIIPPDKPITYENVVSQDMTQRMMSAFEIHRRGHMDSATLMQIIGSSLMILKINNSPLPERRRRTLVHNLITDQDNRIIGGFKYA